MNSLQSELDSINSQLELLTYRKTQLDNIMGEYSDVINRVKSLIGSMEDAMIEPVNLLIEIEGLIHGPEFEAVAIEPTPEPTPEPKPTPEPAAVPKLKPDDIIQHKNNELWHGRQFRVKGVKGFEVLCAWESNTGDVAYSFPADAVQLVHPETETKPTQSTRYSNNIYWDNESSVRVFIPKKRRFKLELEAVANDCIDQGYSLKFEIIECDGDWLVMFSQVISEGSVQGIIDNFYPKHTDGEPEPEPSPEPSPEPTSEPPLLEYLTQSENQPELTQLNSRAWRRENTLLVGFSNKRLLNTWSNWFKSSWSGQIHISENNDKVEGFEHCLGVMWYGSMPEVKRWERLTNLDYAFKPDEQQGIVKAV
ncbi:MAG TPA: hypothetical protein V6D21_21920 [Candidatus Obscuribacterales bacterium]